MPSAFQYRCAARIIQHQGVIAYPTESVYGLGCDPMSEIAVNRILGLKQRELEKGLIIIAASLGQLEPYIDISNEERKTISEHATPITWLVRKSPLTPPWISGRHNSIAIRVSQHPLVQRLCLQLKHPLVSTSANPAAASPANSTLRARLYFGEQIDMYMTGVCGPLKQPTAIFDMQNNRYIR